MREIQRKGERKKGSGEGRERDEGRQQKRGSVRGERKKE